MILKKSFNGFYDFFKSKKKILEPTLKLITMYLDHALPFFKICSASEIAVRLMTYSKEVGLSQLQQNDIVEQMKIWREKYRKQAADHATLFHELMDLYDARPIDLKATQSKIDEILKHLRVHLNDYSVAIKLVSDIINNEQFQTLQNIYQKEKAILKPRECGLI